MVPLVLDVILLSGDKLAGTLGGEATGTKYSSLLSKQK
jgi:hypothetical protein